MNHIRLHCLRHAPFEDAAGIALWAREKGHAVSRTLLYDNQPPPGPDEFDWLVVMGGPMNIYEHDKHPWLAREKRCIEQAVSKGRTVLGVCLGAQLIADVLGGPVTRNRCPEIGWFEVETTPEALTTGLFKDFPGRYPAFHWHGDTFALPPGAVRIAKSEACDNQGFLYKHNVVGLQFHLETTEQGMNRLIEHCGHEIVPGKYVQSAEKMRAHKAHFSEIRSLMVRMLDALARTAA